jgi:hypothetical protein
LAKRVLARTSLLASSIAVKASRAARSAARFSATSSRLRASAHSLKQAFFSPRLLSAEYLLASASIKPVQGPSVLQV